MNVLIDGKDVVLKDSALLGEGGEARVYRWRDLAVKIFHAPTTPLAERMLAEKRAKLAQFPLALPPAVMGPRSLATGKQGEVLGYCMSLVPDAEDFSRLASRKWRLASLPNAGLTSVFAELHAVVAALHARRVVIGDFNDGNVLFAKGHPFLIDSDSMQFGGYGCAVGHERFLDPRLYGVDLSAGPRFDAGSDWYAYAVLLFQSLLAVHPFGGTHSSLPTLLRRAEKRHSVLKSDVVLPRLAVPPKVLPDDLLHWFQAVFERDERQPFPAGMLQLPWTTCSCGLEHARAVCPECRALGSPLTRQVTRVRGRCTSRMVFETSGRVVCAALQGGLRYLSEEQGVLRREDGSTLASSLERSTLSAFISGPSTWLVDGSGRIERWQGDRLVERAQTGTRGNRPVFAASAQGAYRQDQEWLVEQHTGARVGQVLEGQTWLWTGDRLGLGFYRVGGLTVAFLLRAGKAGLKQLAGITWQGRIIEADVAFDARHALLTVVTDAGATDQVHRWLVDEQGTILARGVSGLKGNAAVLNGRVVVASDGGLLAFKNEQGHLIEAAHFTETQSFVSAGDELLPNTDGSLFVVGARDITQLTLT